jgi:hypothetical protein
VKRPRITTLDDFETYVEYVPSRLGCWRDGVDRRYPLLAWLNVQPLVEFRELARKVGPLAAIARQHALHHNQVGIAAGWTTRYMTGPGRSSPANDADRRALLSLAAKYWGVRNLIVEARVGVRGFESKGTAVRLPYVGNRDIDALDRVFDLVETLDSMEVPRRPASSATQQWMAAHATTTTWDAAPIAIRSEMRQMAKHIIDQYDRYLDASVDIGGCTVAEHDAFWTELLARGLYMHGAALRGSVSPEVISPLLDRNRFVDSLATDAGIGTSAAERVTELLTLDLARCQDGALTPIVQVGRSVLPMSSLIIPGSPQRNLLAILQADPSAVGTAGRLLGLAGERQTLTALRRMASATLLGSRVKVLRADGQSAGDLDIVAFDPSTGVAAVFEIKWHIAADGNVEVYRAEQAAIAKRAQVKRLRGEIESGAAVVRWPVAWGERRPRNLRWFVLTRDVLAQRHIETDQVTIRSLQLLKRMLRKDATVADLVKLLDNPPLPPAELRTTMWDTVKYGDVRVEAELVRV